MRAAGEEEAAEAAGCRPPVSVFSLRCSFLRGWGGEGGVHVQAHVSLCFPMCAAAEGSSWEGGCFHNTMWCTHTRICFLRKLAGRKGMCKHIQNCHVQTPQGGCLLTRPWEESTNYSATLQVSKVRPLEVQSLA